MERRFEVNDSSEESMERTSTLHEFTHLKLICLFLHVDLQMIAILDMSINAVSTSISLKKSCEEKHL